MGAGTRLYAAKFDGTFDVSFSDDHRTDYLANAFIQDDITILPDELHVTLGSKLEYNSFTGLEIEPTARAIWTPDDRQSVWAGVSRATRTPSQTTDSISLNSVVPPGDPGNPFPIPVLVTIDGNSDETSEDVVSFELGYRVRPTDDVSIDLAGFYNLYDNLVTVETVGASLQPGFVLVNERFDNLGEARTYGVELAADWRVAPWWQLQGAYTFLHLDIDRASGSNDPLIEQTGRRDPAHQVSLRSSFDIADDLDFDLWGRYVSDLLERGVDGYFTFDARLGWRPTEGVELALVGQNLFDSRHLEFTPELINTTPTEVPRSVYGKITVSF